MSRSYRRPWLQDPANTQAKILHARKYRRITRQITDHWTKTHPDEGSLLLWDNQGEYLHEDYPEYPHRYEVDNPWDIKDWRYLVYSRWSDVLEDWSWSPEDVIKACRK